MTFVGTIPGSRLPALRLVRRRKLQDMNNTHPVSQHSERKALLVEFERLASIGPHLLEDIGFRCNPRLSSPNGTIWERGELRIALDAAGGAALYATDPESDAR